MEENLKVSKKQELIFETSLSKFVKNARVTDLVVISLSMVDDETSKSIFPFIEGNPSTKIVAYSLGSLGRKYYKDSSFNYDTLTNVKSEFVDKTHSFYSKKYKMDVGMWNNCSLTDEYYS